MTSVLIQLLPLAVGSMVMPTWILLVLLLLSSGHGLFEAVAFVGGVTTVRLLQGIVFGVFLGAYDVAHRGGQPSTIASTLLLVAGILLWATAIKQMGRKDRLSSGEPAWVTMVGSLTPIKALGLGALLVVTSSRAWLFTLAAIGIIGQAGLGLAPSVVAFLLYVLGAQLLLVAPIIASVRRSLMLEASARWLEAHNHTVVIAVSLIVGSLFLWLGVAGLMG